MGGGWYQAKNRTLWSRATKKQEKRSAYLGGADALPLGFRELDDKEFVRRAVLLIEYHWLVAAEEVPASRPEAKVVLALCAGHGPRYLTHTHGGNGRAVGTT
jgi:hypothetical protein